MEGEPARAGGSSTPGRVNRVKLEPPAPTAAADVRGARGGGQRAAARVVPEPELTCVRSAKRRAVGFGADAAAHVHEGLAAEPLPACSTCHGEAWLQARCADGVCEQCDNGNQLLAAGPRPLGAVARELSARWAAAGVGAPSHRL
jgi:hypothetical protein